MRWMKNMVVLIDTNIVLDALLQRAPHDKPALAVLELCAAGKIDGYLAFRSLSTLWYVLRKNPETRRRWLLETCEILTVASASHDAAVRAIMQEDFPDFEDCLQEKCAEAVDADYIVTRNTSDYATSKIPAALPENIIEHLK